MRRSSRRAHLLGAERTENTKHEVDGKTDVGQTIEGLQPQTEEPGFYLEEDRRKTWLVVSGRLTLGSPRARWSVSGVQTGGWGGVTVCHDPDTRRGGPPGEWKTRKNP